MAGGFGDAARSTARDVNAIFGEFGLRKAFDETTADALGALSGENRVIFDPELASSISAPAVARIGTSSRVAASSARRRVEQSGGGAFGLNTARVAGQVEGDVLGQGLAQLAELDANAAGLAASIGEANARLEFARQSQVSNAAITLGLARSQALSRLFEVIFAPKAQKKLQEKDFFDKLGAIGGFTQGAGAATSAVIAAVG